MIIRFTPEADAELTGACEWYSHQRKNLDLEFMQCIDDALSRDGTKDGRVNGWTQAHHAFEP
jgi:hypothetical protein